MGGPPWHRTCSCPLSVRLALALIAIGCVGGVNGRGSEIDAGRTIFVIGDGGGTADAGNVDPSELDAGASGAPFDAAIVSTDIPAALACGAPAVLRVTLRNTGTSAWTSGLHRLRATEASHPVAHGLVIELAAPIAPGTAHTFELAFTAPADPGTYATSWRMSDGSADFGAVASGATLVTCTGPTRPLPDMSAIVRQVHEESPDLIRQSCHDTGGNWLFLDAVVDRLRQTDDRWGYNWKRGVIGDASEDVVDYHWGDGPREGSPDTYVVDVIVGHCGDDPQPGWIDVTLPDVLGLWTGRGRF